MRLNRWIALPVAGLAAVVIGVAAVEAAPSPSPSASGSPNVGQMFVDKLAGILHRSRGQTQDALKQAQLQTIDQLRKDGRITQAQADAMKARINAAQGLSLGGGFGLPHTRPFGAKAGLMGQLRIAEMKAAAGALHLNAADLISRLRSGKTLSDLEQASGVSDAAVRTAMTNAARGVLDTAVKAGTLTQGEENLLLSRLGSRVPFGGARPAPPAPAGFFPPI
jgi:hypothetical protein